MADPEHAAHTESQASGSTCRASAADLPHVLEHGFRAGNVRGSVVHGIGLGLAGARLVAQQHGGSLEVTSREGEGTTVTLRLPLEAGAAQPSGAPAPATLA